MMMQPRIAVRLMSSAVESRAKKSSSVFKSDDDNFEIAPEAGKRSFEDLTDAEIETFYKTGVAPADFDPKQQLGLSEAELSALAQSHSVLTTSPDEVLHPQARFEQSMVTKYDQLVNKTEESRLQGRSNTHHTPTQQFSNSAAQQRRQCNLSIAPIEA